MDIRLVDRAAGLDEVKKALASCRRLALDCEAAGFHRYSDRLCLVQLTPDVGPDRPTYLLDPLALSLADAIGPALEDPELEVLMHGADFDIRLLDRDLGIRLRGLFDTQIAAALLGRDELGLSSLLETELGIQLSKKYQRADWAQRPLPRPMLEYAGLDTHHLPELADGLSRELEERSRLEWAREECLELENVRFEEPDDTDPTLRVRAARDMSDREVHRLREALEWRDRVAREQDRAPFRVAGDHVLVNTAREAPESVRELEDLQGFNGRLARDEGDALIRRFREVEQLAPDRVQGLPPREPGGRGRPDPEVEERMRRLKAVRNRRASELGIDRGTLLPNALLLTLAEAPPSGLDELSGTPGIRRWQAAAVGEQLLDALETSHAPTWGS